MKQLRRTRPRSSRVTAPQPSLLGRLTAADPERAYLVARTRLDALDNEDPDRELIALRVTTMRALALAAKELGRLNEGLRALRDALTLAESAGRAHTAAQVRMNQVGLLAAAGDIPGALTAASAAEPILDGADADQLAANRVCALARGGRIDEALAAARRVLPRLRTGNDPVALAGLLVNVALTRSMKGDLAAAESALSEALEAAGGLQHLAAVIKCNLAFIAARRGDLPRALRLYATVEPTLTGERSAQCRLDRAGALIAAGLPAEARELLKETLAEITARGYDCDVADGQLLLAHAELAAGDAEEAATTAEHARTLFAEQERTGWMPLAEHLLLRARWATGDRSPVFFRTAVATADRLEQGGWTEAAADARIIAARLGLELGRRPDALLGRVAGSRWKGPAELRAAAWHATALARAARGDRRGAASAVWAGLRVVSDHADVFGALELRAHAGRLGADLAELGIAMARSGRELLAAEERRRALLRRPLAACPPADPLLAEALAELRAVSAEHATATARGDDTAELAERLIRLEAAVRLRSRGRDGIATVALPPMSRARSASASATSAGAGAGGGAMPSGSAAPPVSAAPGALGAPGAPAGSARAIGPAEGQASSSSSVRSAASSRTADLPGRLVPALGDRALVELIKCGDTLHAVVIADGRCRRRPLCDHDEVEAAARLLRFELHRLARRGPAGEGVDLSGLAHARGTVERLLLAPLRDVLGERELVIAPTGALHGLSWPALPSLSGRPVTIVPSAASWLAAREARSAAREARSAARSAARSGARQATGRVALIAGPGLRHADDEVTRLAALYPGATVLRGDDTSSVAVRRALDGAALAHLATHGEFRHGNALFSRLQLSDGPLMAHDLESLRTPPRVVVLSACDAGRADAGDAVMGIVSVLLAFGTSTVIAAVTPVGDAAARDFMVAFHRLLRGGTSPARALAAVPRAHGALGFVCFGAG